MILHKCYGVLPHSATLKPEAEYGIPAPRQIPACHLACPNPTQSSACHHACPTLCLPALRQILPALNCPTMKYNIQESQGFGLVQPMVLIEDKY